MTGPGANAAFLLEKVIVTAAGGAAPVLALPRRMFLKR
jgi:hypothetical protein